MAQGTPKPHLQQPHGPENLEREGGAWVAENSSANCIPRAAFPPSSTPFFLGMAELGLFIPSPSTGVRQRLRGCGRRERASVESQLNNTSGGTGCFPWHGEQQQGKWMIHPDKLKRKGGEKKKEKQTPPRNPRSGRRRRKQRLEKIWQ